MNWVIFKASAALLAWAKATVINVPAHPFIRTELNGNCSGDQGCGVQELAKELSSCSDIYFPGSAEFNNILLRWSSFEAPQANMVVVPCIEEDVATAVKYANKKKLPFLAVNSGHGTITSLGKMDFGIQISLEKLASVEVANDGKSATIGGGAGSKDVTDALWAEGKQTVTGTCECVSYMGPALGGGHGYLQGRHGLASDQFLSLNVVLADGTLKKFDAKDDLFWGMRGAGHNFGIVTSVTSKIYDIKHRDWAVAVLTFKSNKVEAIYEAANTYFINGSRPIDVINWIFWFNNATVDANNPIISVQIIQEGVQSIDKIWLEPFLKLNPVAAVYNFGNYHNLSTWTGFSAASPICQKTGRRYSRFPLYLKSYNITAQKDAFKLFAENTGSGSPFYNSRGIFEGYPTSGVQAFPLEESAFAFRDTELLVAIAVIHQPGNAEVDKKVAELGERFREILQQGSGLKSRLVYVNYAYGDEPPKELYGAEQWRQNRLQSLKRKYDPKGSYDFYGPIP